MKGKSGYYIMEDEYVTASGMRFRYSVMRPNGSRCFRAESHGFAVEILDRLDVTTSGRRF